MDEKNSYMDRILTIPCCNNGNSAMEVMAMQNNNPSGVMNAINLGNLNLIQQLKDCCCQNQRQVIEMGYQNQIQTINQTNDLQTALRVENGLTRTEVAAFRQAWEQSKYNDVVAEKTRLQTELDLLRTNQTTQAYFQQFVAPLQAQLNNLTYQLTGKSAQNVAQTNG